MTPTPRHALLIDDEPLARLELRRLLQSHPEISIRGEAGNLNDSRELLSRPDYDLVFLDVQLRGGTGFDLLDSLNPAAQVVFVTAHDRFALRAFEVNALDFLLKPVAPARLATTLQRLGAPQAVSPAPGAPASIGPANHRLTLEDRVFIKTGHVTRFIPIASLCAVCSCENYTQLILAGGESLMVLRPLKAWQEVLPPDVFVRIHRQTVVNLCRVKRIERKDADEMLFWIDAPVPPLNASRRQVAELRHHLEVLGLEGLLP